MGPSQKHIVHACGGGLRRMWESHTRRDMGEGSELVRSGGAEVGKYVHSRHPSQDAVGE
tara:strand:+ start:30809 stop:30985 length:177 start_codon:yes stop_codon:yes gene_type:complete